MSITYEDIEKANKAIKTVDIKGKNYAEVKERIKAFKKLYPEGFIHAKMESNAEGICVFTAEVGYFREDGSKAVLGTGTAHEKESASYINKTSYIENCETSAVGRALGMAGLGIDTDIASANDMRNVEAKEEAAEKMGTPIPQAITADEVAQINAELERTGKDPGMILEMFGIHTFEEMQPAQFVACMNKFKKTPDKE